MNYVKRVIETQYGKQAELRIKSIIGQGTTVFLSLPVMEGIEG
ncbi:MAG: sensor histidine kinase, partial [Paenibacillus sp.]|nr:sensor histidine kinase [Paenibacillus sp.]